MQSPQNNDGPFVSNSRGPGLLRRLLGGGSNDPTAPHGHLDPSTTSMHAQPLERAGQPTPVAPKQSPFATAGTDTFGGKPATKQRPLVLSIIVWLFKHPRIGITVVALLLVFIGQLSDGPSKLEQQSQDLQQLRDDIADSDFGNDVQVEVPEINIPEMVSPQTGAPVAPTAPTAPTAPSASPPAGSGTAATAASSFSAKITRVTGNTVYIDSPAGKFAWLSDRPAVTAALAKNTGEQAFIFWELRDTKIYVTGVSGPKGSAPPR